MGPATIPPSDTRRAVLLDTEAQEFLDHAEVLKSHATAARQTQRGAAEGTHRQFREALQLCLRSPEAAGQLKRPRNAFVNYARICATYGDDRQIYDISSI